MSNNHWFQMPYYHIKIRRKKGRPPILYFFDLSKDSLSFFLKQARKGVEAFLPGTYDAVETQYISEISIAKTSRKSSHYGIGYMKGENVFEKGKDVTGLFVTIPRKKVRTTSSLRKISKRIFVVHGKDHKTLDELKTILKDLQLTPIVLHEQPSGSRTIVEKLEKYSDVDYAFVILTPDDIGGSRHKYDIYLSKIDIRPLEDFSERARQNVILEFGYFIGKLGRDRVCCLHKGKVELPSDMHGIVYIPFKESVNEVRGKITEELKAAGYDIKK